MLKRSFGYLFILSITILGAHCGIIKKNYEEGDHMEGDILLPPSSDGLTWLDRMRFWKNGIVPYKYESNYPNEAKYNINRAMEEFHKYTCIKFQEAKANDSNYIIIKNTENDCSSYVGMITGEQVVNLDAKVCVGVGTIIHEFMHALGVFHEHNRPDRDQHINILWDNIREKYKFAFQIPKDKTSSYDLPYNIKSIMHYQATAFSIDNISKTITAKNKRIPDDALGQRINFSAYDIVRINRMYNCTNPDGLKFIKDD